LRDVKYNKIHSRLLLAKEQLIPQVIIDRSRIINPGPFKPPTLNALYSGNATCARELMVVKIVDGLSNMSIIRTNYREDYTFQLVSPSEWEDVGPFRAIKVLHHNNHWSVLIPEGLIWSSYMTEELLVFLLLHELGHSLRSQEQETEYFADRWAVEEGLPAYYGTERAMDLLPVIVNQFENYNRMEFTPETYGFSSSSTGPINRYPNLNCRLIGILSGFRSSWVGEMIHGYPAHCWNNTTGHGPVIDPLRPWARVGCCEEDIHENSMPDHATLQEEQTKAWRALDIDQLCKEDEQYCDLDPNKAQALFRSQVKQYDRRLKQLKGAQHRANTLIRSLKEARITKGHRADR